MKIWRRSYDIPPPPLGADDQRHPRLRSALRGRRSGQLLPATESLKDTLARVLPFWHARIAPELRSGRNVLVVAHGNSLRAMVKMLDDGRESGHRRAQHSDRRAAALRARRRSSSRARSRYLGDPAAIAAAAEAVKRQTEKR